MQRYQKTGATMNSRKRLFALLAWILAAAAAEAQPGDLAAFSMKIMDAFEIMGRGTVLTGRVDAGSLAPGDAVCVPLVSGQTVARQVEGIEGFSKMLERAEVRQNVGILVTGVNSKDVKKGGNLLSGCEIEIVDE
jgi:elongation factor Tu